MYTLHEFVFDTEASIQTQVKPWQIAAEFTQAPAALAQASWQGPLSSCVLWGEG